MRTNEQKKLSREELYLNEERGEETVNLTRYLQKFCLDAVKVSPIDIDLAPITSPPSPAIQDTPVAA